MIVIVFLLHTLGCTGVLSAHDCDCIPVNTLGCTGVLSAHDCDCSVLVY